MRIFIIAIVCLLFCTLQAQERSWEQKMGNPNVSFFEVQDDFYKYWNSQEIPSGAGHKPFKRWEYLMETRVDKDGFFNPIHTIREGEKFASKFPTYKNNNPWTILGPTNEPNGNNGIGRINVIQVHPDNPDTIYVGTPAGGLWFSYDDGNTWSTVTDQLESIGVSDIAFDPVNPDIMYIATGDRDHLDTPTTGIMKSTDGGLNWVYTNFQPGMNGLPDFFLVHRILVDPTDGDVILAATTSGIFKSINGGTTWTHTFSTSCVRHMEFHPTNPNTVYGTSSTAYCGGGSTALFFKSLNNGTNWTATTLPGGGGLDRVAIGVSEDSPNDVYLLGAENDSSNSNDFSALYKSTNSGILFTEITPTHEPSLGSQQWYDWSFTVDPDDSDVMYAGGVHIEKTVDGGLTWTRVSNNGPNNVHVDHHYARFFGDFIYLGSDGGIWRSDNGASSWENLNDGLAITQYYRISNAETDEDILLAGAQDNGTHQYDSGTWTHEFGGDGMDNAIDPTDEDNLFVSYQFGNFFRSTNGGGNFTSMISSSTTGTTGAWVTPIKIAESNPSTMYVGYNRIWKSVNNGITWTDPYGQSLTGTSKLQYIDVAPSDANTIYTTNYSTIWKSTNGGTSWATTTDPGNSIRWIEIDPVDPNHVWITSARKVFETTNGGNSWTDITGALPDIDMNTIVYDANSNDALYLGTDYGVYYKDNTTSGWQPFGVDLPNVVVLELDIIESEDKLRAGTFGRGVWEADLAAPPCMITNIDDIGIESCDIINNRYVRAVEVHYSSAPNMGSLVVNNQSFNITSSPQQVFITLVPDGNTIDITAEFSANTSCSLIMNDLITNPTISTYYIDNDDDGYGDANTSVVDCTPPSGYATNDTDCDDNNDSIYPGAPELCDGIINDCNNGTLASDEVDYDNDGYVECMIDVGGWQGNTSVIGGEDCDDTNNNVFPGASEVCDGLDNNCDGNIDENGTLVFYADTDNDTYGDSNNSITACAAQAGYVTDNTDCDDTDNTVFPGAPELCDGMDNNCDGSIDEGVLNTYYADTDNDGYGDAASTIQDCTAPTGYVNNNTDCDDNNSNVYPGNTESCDGIDNNCNNVTDEGCGPPPDCDGDYLVINTITQNSYHAEINITSDALVNNGQSILYTAGSTINLEAHFEVVQGTQFEAKITPCIVTGANIILDENDNIIDRNLKQIYKDITDLVKNGNIKELTLTHVNGDIQVTIDQYDTYEQFSNSIIKNNAEGIYMLKADNGQNQIVQKIVLVK